MPMIADTIMSTPCEACDPQDAKAAEAQAPELALTQSEIALVKQAAAQSQINPGAYPVASPVDARRTLFYSMNEADSVRQQLIAGGHEDIAHIIDEAIEAMMQRWYDLRKNP